MRNFIFGVEDSLVSTVGLLSGIAIAGIPRIHILLTGTILVFVEAFSMAAGAFLAEHSAADYLGHEPHEREHTMAAGIIMFVSYFLSGFVPLLPYVMTNPSTAMPYSILASLMGLVILGFISARLSKTKVLNSIIRMTVIGGIAVAIGVGVGMWVRA